MKIHQLLVNICMLTVLLLPLIACQSMPAVIEFTPTVSPDASSTSPPPPTLYNEAPLLTDLVVAGELPPVDDRLPSEPTIIEPVSTIGEYGGVWHTVTGWEDGRDIFKMLYEPPLRWKADYTAYEPGLATYEWSSDGKTFTLHFHEGIKWSDGIAFSMEDIKFWWEDFALNSDMASTQVPRYMLKSDGQTPVDVAFPDDHTWVWKSDQVMWVSPYILAQDYGEWHQMLKPKHYLVDQHPKYNSEIDYEEFNQFDRFWATPGYPCLFAWCLQEYMVGESWLWSRNPYYWKVDTAGNQLPYIDSVAVELVQNKENRLLKISEGAYEASFHGTDDPGDIPFLLEQSVANQYQIVPGWRSGLGAWPGWLINQNYNGRVPEAVEIRELLRNKWFRKGLSVALDRLRFVDIVWAGLSTPQQATLSPQSWHFAKTEGSSILAEWQQADAEYDVAKAEEYFERAGFFDQDSDGWRELPSGIPFELVIDLSDWDVPFLPQHATELAKEYLEAVGIKVQIYNIQEQTQWIQRQQQGLYMLRNMPAFGMDVWTSPAWIFPLDNNYAWPLEGLYYQSGGMVGWEPEMGSPAARLLNLYHLGMQTSSVDERHKILWEAIRVHIDDGPFLVGVTGDHAIPVVVKTGFNNVPSDGVSGLWSPASPGNDHPEQFWMSDFLR